jgi:hypothetical protein
MPDARESPSSSPRFPAASEVELRLALIRERYGDRLTPEQVEELRKTLEVQVDNARALRAVPLTNADEPYPPFAPYRAEP